MTHEAFEAPTAPLVRRSLGGLLLFIALCAAGGGLYGVSGAEAIPLAWLEGSPFHSYLVPSVILLVVVGGALLVAGLAVLRSRPKARAAALLAGTILLVWIGVQVAIIGYVSWLQPAVGLAGLAIVALARRLPRVAGPDRA